MTMYLSAITYTHGAPRPIRELGEAGSDDPQLKEDLLELCCESSVSVLDMACDVAKQTVAAAGVTPDMVVYATDTAEDRTMDAVKSIADAAGLKSAVPLGASGHACGNFGLLLRLAAGLLHDSAAVLLITSDGARGGPRMMSDNLSVLSDGAAAVLVTRDAPAAPAPAFAVHDVVIAGDLSRRSDHAGLYGQRQAVQLGRAAAAALRAKSGAVPADFAWAMFNNYRLATQRFLSGAAGFKAPQLLLGPVAEHAHSFAADLLVNCDVLSRSKALSPGDRVALSSTGPHTWALADVEVLRT
ncbi:hypothetical protein [Dactylosporangium matsuzakiense]|uniref:3-oxoacyl-[acyl-carrier-protein] synthase-3 n=1 Tax=Dactylosporangium matsuzakiense TaxID=53360 RepID=A0A9W6KGQ2_9ACTN|nr:hypothetical protein [Dactylosporangium matsuzakiense]GLK99168.1 hypothetical protein GCM10017581_009090 [Dactylosporangium matsuzakiense]